MEQVLAWRENINDRVTALLKKSSSATLLWLLQLGINHEQQHQELLLTDIHHLFSNNSLYPVYFREMDLTKSEDVQFEWLKGISGLVNTGYEGDDFHFDNETPKHSVLNQSHAIGNRLVTNSEWLQFIEDDGYRDFRWWFDTGWAWLQAHEITAPLYWKKTDNKDYARFSLNGDLPLDINAPVSNISYFEADAFTRWASKNISKYSGARLPTEFEWEAFAKSDAKTSNDLFGKVWQWTSSNYSAYPGYQPWDGAAGEYNGKFMVDQMVLRGSSSYTPSNHSRASYRNFFPTQTRWQMTGLRLAKDNG